MIRKLGILILGLALGGCSVHLGFEAERTFEPFAVPLERFPDVNPHVSSDPYWRPFVYYHAWTGRMVLTTAVPEDRASFDYVYGFRLRVRGWQDLGCLGC